MRKNIETFYKNLVLGSCCTWTVRKHDKSFIQRLFNNLHYILRKPLARYFGESTAQIVLYIAFLLHNERFGALCLHENVF